MQPNIDDIDPYQTVVLERFGEQLSQQFGVGFARG
jgi:hypothetical protein